MELLNIMIQKYSNKNDDSCPTYKDLCNIQPTPSRPHPHPKPHPPPLSPYQTARYKNDKYDL